MKWSVIRLIAIKELRDLLRDRRTVALILVLPAVLYVLFGLAAFLFALATTSQPTTFGVAGWEPMSRQPGKFPDFSIDGQLAPDLIEKLDVRTTVFVLPVSDDPDGALRSRKVDAVLLFPPGFVQDLAAGKRPAVKVLTRDGDEKSKLAGKRMMSAAKSWEGKLREKRFVEKGLPADFDKIINLEDQHTDSPRGKKEADDLRDHLVRVFPFILMMWVITAAIQPAVDITAGEKERGTMETLLISPAARVEIVLGKFLAITAFAYTAVVWNVLWFVGGGLFLEFLFGFPVFNYVGLLGCVVLGLPLAMFISAMCLAVGVFAKSTKEGQYYMMPMILLTMALSLLSMVPGKELDATNCWVPISAAMLMQQRMLSVSEEAIPWEYLPAVLGSLCVWSGLALAFAVRQFNRESILFRESGGPK